MTMSEKDFERIAAMQQAIAEKQSSSFEKKLSEQSITMMDRVLQAIEDEGRDSRDFTLQTVQAATSELRKEMNEMETRINKNVGDLVGGAVLPQIEEHEIRIVKLESKVSV